MTEFSSAAVCFSLVEDGERGVAISLFVEARIFRRAQTDSEVSDKANLFEAGVAEKSFVKVSHVGSTAGDDKSADELRLLIL